MINHGRAFNIAYGGQVSIKELYFTIARLLNCQLDSIYRDNRPGDIPHSNADISDTRECFMYNPSYSFEDDIKLAIEWYKIISREQDKKAPKGNRRQDLLL